MTLRSSIVAFSLVFLLAGNAFAQREYAPVAEHKIKYADWTYPDVNSGELINLRDFAEGKKLLLVFYFAPSCHNSRHDMPYIEELHKQYASAGLGVIGVNVYASRERLLRELEEQKITFPVVNETWLRSDRKKTPHYKYRQRSGDDRKWGTPYSVFLSVADLRPKGDMLMRRTFVVNGELIRDEAERFIREKLGLPSSETAAENSAEGLEICEEEDILKTP